MPRTLQKEIDKLKKRILTLSALVEERVRIAVRSVDDRDHRLADRVIDGDLEIDEMEVDIEEDCLKILALHQPVAIDLRFIIAVLKINSDLERIGDYAVNIAERARLLASKERIGFPFDFASMSEKVQEMVRTSLDALVNMDAGLARAVFMRDNEVDDINREMYKNVEEAMHHRPDHIEHLINLMGVSRNLERIADHATNIAEDILYMIDGEIVRHRAKYSCPA
jgi:phosphate transport system protein